ncbi:effector-associated constant component EACC1 [Streptomyces chartreusis]
MAEVRIILDGDDTAGESLWDWLRQESGLRGRVRHAYQPPQRGAMGSVTELVIEGLISGTTGALAGLLGQSLSAWLAQRLARGDTRTTITLTTTAGTSVSLTAERSADVESLVRSALLALNSQPATAADPAADAQGG